jgi:hypothetical protein
LASTPFRRPDVLRTVRGANLTGTRERPVRQFDTFEARPGTLLGRTIQVRETETSLFEAGRHIDDGRYTEPND